MEILVTIFISQIYLLSSKRTNVNSISLPFSKYFKKRFWSSFWVFVVLLLALALVRNKAILLPFLEKAFNFSWKTSVSAELVLKQYLPKSDFSDEVIEREKYLISYNQKANQPRYTIHILADSLSRGSVTRYDMKIDDSERIYSHTPKWSDYINTGYDRGHMVPAGDFKCCESLMRATFKMSNIAAFDSVFNRYAWSELEQYTRFKSRNNGLVVITGAVFESNTTIQSSNRISVPSHFYKILINHKAESIKPRALEAYLMPNQPLKNVDLKSYQVSVDLIETLSGLNFFSHLTEEEQEQIESKKGYGNL